MGGSECLEEGEDLYQRLGVDRFKDRSWKRGVDRLELGMKCDRRRKVLR